MTIMLSDLHKALISAGVSNELAVKAAVEVFEEMRRRRGIETIPPWQLVIFAMAVGTIFLIGFTLALFILAGKSC
jgi:hypothetical protein